MAECRLLRAVPLISDLDRLAREAFFQLGLETAAAEFAAADMPPANRLAAKIMSPVVEAARNLGARTNATRSAAAAWRTVEGAPHVGAA